MSAPGLLEQKEEREANAASVKDRIARSVVWLIWSRGVLQVVSFASTAAVARLLAPSDYGLLALGCLWIYALSLVSDLGLGAAIVQFADLTDEELDTCFWLTLGIAALGALFLWAAAPEIAALLETPMLSPVLRVLCMALPLTTLRVVPEGLLRKRLALDRLSQANIAVVLASLPVVYGMAWLGYGVWALVAGYLASLFIQAALSFWFAAWWPGFHVGGRRMAEMLRYGLATLGARLCLTLYQDSADLAVLGRVSGEVTVGFYSMAKQLALMPVEKIALVISQIASPVMAGLQADDVSLRTWFFRSIRIVAWITFPMNIGLMLLGRDIVDLVLTAKWRSITPTLYPLCIFAMVRSLDMLLTCVFLARYRTKELFRYQLTLLGVMPVAFWAGSTLGGAFGVAIAWAVVFPVVALFMARDALKACGASWRELGAELWPPTVATLSLAAAIVAAKWALPTWAVETPLARVLVAGGLAAAAYGTVLLRTRGPIRGEIRQVATWFLRRSALPEPAK